MCTPIVASRPTLGLKATTNHGVRRNVEISVSKATLVIPRCRSDRRDIRFSHPIAHSRTFPPGSRSSRCDSFHRSPYWRRNHRSGKLGSCPHSNVWVVQVSSLGASPCPTWHSSNTHGLANAWCRCPIRRGRISVIRRGLSLGRNTRPRSNSAVQRLVRQAVWSSMRLDDGSSRLGRLETEQLERWKALARELD